MKEIVWLEDPNNFVYLREATSWTTRRKGKIGLKDNPEYGKLVGYEEFPINDDGVYIRRFWWLKKHDWDICHGKPLGEIYPKQGQGDRENWYTPTVGLAPCEAVVPSSISTEINSVQFDWRKHYQ